MISMKLLYRKLLKNYTFDLRENYRIIENNTINSKISKNYESVQ